MWLLLASIPLLPAVAMVWRRCRAKVGELWRRAAAWALRLARGGACARRTHAFVFSACTHGKADSVLETFDLYAGTHPSACVGPQIGEALDEVVRRVAPARALELGMHCGYASVRLLRLLPSAGRLIAVELDPLAAELGEELILVAGFKHAQFQVLTCSSGEAIPTLRPLLEPHRGFSLVLMDHDPHEYLQDLLALEREELLCPSGCSVVLIVRSARDGGLMEVMDYVRGRPGDYCVKTERHFMVEIFFQKERWLE